MDGGAGRGLPGSPPGKKRGRQKTCGASGSGRGKSPRRQKPPEHRGGETPPEGKPSGRRNLSRSAAKAKPQRRQTLSEGKTSARQKPSEGKPSAKAKPFGLRVVTPEYKPSYSKNKKLKIERLYLDVTYRNPGAHEPFRQKGEGRGALCLHGLATVRHRRTLAGSGGPHYPGEGITLPLVLRPPQGQPQGPQQAQPRAWKP